jgi:hypothetical protein
VVRAVNYVLDETVCPEAGRGARSTLLPPALPEYFGACGMGSFRLPDHAGGRHLRAVRLLPVTLNSGGIAQLGLIGVLVIFPPGAPLA